jgi:hypothetical protein
VQPQKFSENTPQQPNQNTNIGAVNKTQSTSINQSNKGMGEAMSASSELDKGVKAPTSINTETSARWGFTDHIKQAAIERVGGQLEERTGLKGVDSIKAQGQPNTQQPSRTSIPDGGVPLNRTPENRTPQINHTISHKAPGPQSPQMPNLKLPRFK